MRRVAALNSLRIRVEAHANTTERAVIRQQVLFMQTRVQPYPTDELRTNDLAALPEPPLCILIEHDADPRDSTHCDDLSDN